MTRSITAIACCAVLAGCHGSSHAAAPSTAAAADGSSVAYAAAASETQAYLNAWVQDGTDNAAAQYLKADEQLSPVPGSSAVDAATLLAGTVVSYELRHWTSPKRVHAARHDELALRRRPCVASMG